jgi:hypothetical protein
VLHALVTGSFPRLHERVGVDFSPVRFQRGIVVRYVELDDSRERPETRLPRLNGRWR